MIHYEILIHIDMSCTNYGSFTSLAWLLILTVYTLVFLIIIIWSLISGLICEVNSCDLVIMVNWLSSSFAINRVQFVNYYSIWAEPYSTSKNSILKLIHVESPIFKNGFIYETTRNTISLQLSDHIYQY